MADKKITMIYGFLTSLASKVTCMFRGQSTDVQSALDSIGAYSTNEEIVGTWIDGNTLYRKTIINTCPLVNGEGLFELFPIESSKLCVFSAIVKRDGADWSAPAPYHHSTTGQTITVYQFNGKMYCNFTGFGTTTANYTVVTTIEYIK